MINQQVDGELLTILNQIPAAIEKAFYEAMVLRHPGHANQKTHGNRFGAGQAKESFRRLKDDKGAREKYKAKARKERASKESSSKWWDDFASGKIDAPKPRATKPKAPRAQSAPKSNFYRKYKTQTKESNPLGSDRSAAASLDASGGGMGAASAMTRRPRKK